MELKHCAIERIPWFQRFIFIIFIAKERGKINLWNQGIERTFSSSKFTEIFDSRKCNSL
jgi:hypothetical protein